MAHRSTHRRPWRLSSSRVGCLLLLPAVCSAWQTPGGVRRVQHTSRWRLQQDSLLAGRDRDGVRTSPRLHECSRVGVLRCSAGLAAVDEPASGSDVSVGKYSKKMQCLKVKRRCVETTMTQDIAGGAPQVWRQLPAHTLGGTSLTDKISSGERS